MRRAVAAAVLICLVTWALEAPAAGPKPANPRANFTFHDREDDHIRSDGGSYVNGVGGVVGQIYATGSGDATLNLYRTRPKRVFVGTYDGAGQQPGTPTGTFADGWFINIHNVWNMADGTTTPTLASFTTGVGDFRWCGAGTAPAWCEDLMGSQTVWVTRTTNSWNVVADLEVNMPNLLLQPYRSGALIAGYYTMPFRLTIDLQP